MRFLQPAITLMFLIQPVFNAHAAGTGTPKTSMGTRDELRACMKSKDNLTARQQVVAHNAEVNQTRMRELQTRAKAIADAQSELNRSDERQLENFNAKVVEHNRFVEASNLQAQEIQDMQDQLSTDQRTYNATCATLIFRISDIDAVRRERNAANTD